MKISLYLYVLLRFLKNPPELKVVINFLKFQLNKWTKQTTLNFHPVSIIISATKRCNFACEFCFVENYMAESPGKEGDLTPEELNKILETDAAKAALRIGFLGGEPFLNKNIFEYIEILHKKRKVTSVVTNSALLKGEMLEKLKVSSLDVLGLSLYDNNREDIKRVAAAIKGKKRFWMQSVIDSTTIHHMEDKIRFALDIGCKELIFDNYYPKTKDRMKKVLFEDNTEYKSEEKRLKEKYKGQIYITWVPLIPLEERKVKHCVLPMSYVQLDNAGNIGPCCVRAPAKEFGNIFSTEGWNSPAIVSLRESLTNPDKKAHDICRFCQCLNEDLYQL